MPTRISDLPEYTTITASAFMPIVDVNELLASKNKKIQITNLRKYFYRNSNLSSSFTQHTPGFYYFGDNSDGPGIFTGSITTLRTRITASFSSSLDGPPVIKNFSTLFISRSVTISPPRRCRGMLIFVDGDATISGSLTMTARGAKFTGSDASFTTVNPPYLGDYWSAQLFPSASYLSRVFAVGAAGATTVAPGVGVTGTTGVFGRSGGGGSGGSSAPYAQCLGSAGTSFSGGSGGAGTGATPAPLTTNAYAFGGAGGFAPSATVGGGAGNPGGNPGGVASTLGGNGTGGLLILIVRGDLKIGPNGNITTNGIAGGTGSPGQGGGGSGGGVLYVYYGGRLTNNGTVTSSGGSGGGGPAAAGGAGGAGTAIIQKLNTAFPIAN